MLKVVFKKFEKNKISYLDVINSIGKCLILYWISDKYVFIYYLNKLILIKLMLYIFIYIIKVYF